MAQKSLIQQLLAAVLLLIFSFSITPKKFLHDAIANHKDKALGESDRHTPQFSHSGFVCKCDNQVAESPFTDAIARFGFTSFRVFFPYKQAECGDYFYSTIVFFQRRGPPVANRFS